jgi:hypothetical protein
MNLEMEHSKQITNVTAKPMFKFWCNISVSSGELAISVDDQDDRSNFELSLGQFCKRLT